MRSLLQAIRLHLLTLILILLAGFATVPAMAGFLHGYVYTRNVVTNEAGNYTWGEYNPATGAYVRDIAEASGPDFSPSYWRVMSGDEYRSYVKQKTDAHKPPNDDLVLMSRADYDADSFPLADGSARTKPRPVLANTTAYVSVIPQARRFIDDPG